MRTSAWALLLSLYAIDSVAGDWSGYLETELRLFPHSPVDDAQHGNNLSLAFQPEFYQAWDDGRQSFTFVPFIRIDQHDDERTHFDIRELTWLKVDADWEIRLGLRKVFWGVAESQHLVDIINQTDRVENIDLEDKLGQPMINLALVRDWGTLDIFLLPYFRERTFPGEDGRLRTQPYVDEDQAKYESGARQHRLDLALRWTRSLDIWDIGLAWFYGTSRDPRLLPSTNASGEPVLIPYYDVIHQLSLDLQATTGSWLWKLETLYRNGQGPHYGALVGGFEYTFYGIADGPMDVGVLLEYHYDTRGHEAATPFEDDVFLGARLALNDPQSSEALMGFIVDRDSGGLSFNLEASRRMGDQWKIELETRIFSGQDRADPVYAFRRDDYAQVTLSYHF